MNLKESEGKKDYFAMSFGLVANKAEQKPAISCIWLYWKHLIKGIPRCLIKHIQQHILSCIPCLIMVQASYNSWSFKDGDTHCSYRLSCHPCLISCVTQRKGKWDSILDKWLSFLFLSSGVKQEKSKIIRFVIANTIDFYFFLFSNSFHDFFEMHQNCPIVAYQEQQLLIEYHV